MSSVLFLGHGRRAWRENEAPRCAPMAMEEWDRLIATTSETMFLDFAAYEEPDILENVGNDWSKYIDKESVDFIVDMITHLSIPERYSIHYWNSVKHALKPDGTYIGWNNSNVVPASNRRIRLCKSEIDGFLKERLDGILCKRTKRFKLMEF